MGHIEWDGETYDVGYVPFMRIGIIVVFEAAAEAIVGADAVLWMGPQNAKDKEDEDLHGLDQRGDRGDLERLHSLSV